VNPLEELIAEYRRELPHKVERLTALWHARDIPRLQQALHGLIGSAGTFGLPELSNAAREADAYLEAHATELDVPKFQRLFDAVCSKAASAR
jgi:HPt (histidine-containing phosphotransfer) domain-containing protein